MNLSQEDIWTDIAELKKLESSSFYLPYVTKLLSYILNKYKIEDKAAEDELYTILKCQLRLYRIRDRHKKPSTETIFNYDHDEAPCIQPQISEKPPAKRKKFCDLRPNNISSKLIENTSLPLFLEKGVSTCCLKYFKILSKLPQ